MANEFEEGLNNLVSEQFKDGEVLALRDETTGKFITDKEDEHDEEVGAREEDAADNEDGSNNDEDGSNNDEEDDDKKDDEEYDDKKDDEPVEDKPHKKPRAEKRIDALTATVRRLERDLRAEREAKTAAVEAEKRVPKKADGTPYTSANDYALDKLASDEKAPKKPRADAKGADGKPLYKLGEFDEQYAEDKDDYLDARRRYLDAKEKEYDTAVATPAPAAAAAPQQELQTKINEKIEAGKKAYKDFDEKVVQGIAKDAWPLSEAGAHFLADSEVGADIAYALASDVKLAKEIAELSPVAQIKRFTKLEDKLIADNAEKAKRAKRGSSAPEPIHNKAKGGGRAETNRFDGEDFEAVEKNWNSANKRK